MHKEFIESNRLILDKIKAKFPNGIKKLGAPLDDPIVSPYTYPFIFLADRDPTGDEPAIYNGYAGLILFWENTTTGDFFISPDNTASPLVWNKIASNANLLTMLVDLGWQINTDRTYLASGTSLNTSRQPSLSSDTFAIASINQNNASLTTTACAAQISADNATWITIATIEDAPGIDSNKTVIMNFIVPMGYYYRLESSGTGTVTLISCNELPQ